jgi:hypothetical protein
MEQMNLKYKGHTTYTRVIGALTKGKGEVQGRRNTRIDQL